MANQQQQRRRRTSVNSPNTNTNNNNTDLWHQWWYFDRKKNDHHCLPLKKLSQTPKTGQQQRSTMASSSSSSRWPHRHKCLTDTVIRPQISHYHRSVIRLSSSLSPSSLAPSMLSMLILLFTISLCVWTTCVDGSSESSVSGTYHHPHQWRPSSTMSQVPPSLSTATSANSSNKRHLVHPHTAAEYFYADDKLADEQVANFVQSLQQNHHHQNATVSLSPTATSGHRIHLSSSPSSSLSSSSSSMGQTSQASSVFPASLLTRPSLPTGQLQSPPSLSNFGYSSPRPSTPVHQHSHELFVANKSSLSPASSSGKDHSISSSLIRQPHNTNYQQPKGGGGSNNNYSHEQVNHYPVRSAPQNLEDLSWVQPVYIHKPSVVNLNQTTTANKNDRVKLNAFVSIEPNNDVDESAKVSNNNLTQTIKHIVNSSTENGDDTVAVVSQKTESQSILANITFSLRDEQWVAPIIALSTLNIMVIVGFECFVIYRACRTCPSRRHLFLGQMLLLGLLLSSVMGIAFVPTSSWLTCTLIRAGVGVCYAIVYGTLLVKTVFLLSLHTGVYLSAEYQALLLFFIISTQVAIDGQWLVHRHSSIVIDYMDGYGHAVYKCDHSTNQLLLSLVYIMILIVLIAVMSFRVRGYRENHGEALFIGISALCMVVLWLVWIAGTITSTPHYRDGFIAFGVVANATLIFIIMFLPKGRQMAAVGREGHLDDRDQLSTASSPSIYTPSFLHIKPVSQLIPLGKPSIAGLSSVGVSSGLSGGSASAYHLYKQFQGTGTTLTSPISTTAPPGPFSVGGGGGGSGMPNSYSSHAIFQSSSQPPNTDRNTKLLADQHEDDENNDPNYSNLSNVFAIGSNTTNGGLTAQAAAASNLNSPASENNSSSSSGGASSSQVSSQNSKSSKSSSQASKGSSSRPMQQQSVKTPVGNNNSDCFFYLQPPPLPPPSSRPPPPPGNGGGNGNSSQQPQQSQQSQPSDRQSRESRLPPPWRQTCYTSAFHHRGHPTSSVGLHHYPKSLGIGVGGGGGGVGSAGIPYGHHSNSIASTPLGPPPSGPLHPSHHHHHHHHHHNLLSPSSDNETTSFYHFASYDAAGSATRQLLAASATAASNNQTTNSGHGNSNSNNFKYFRGGPLY